MKTIILDRDGVINKNPPNYGYVTSWKEFTFLPNALEAIINLTKYGFRIFVATNQAGIGKSIFTQKQLSIIHQQMLSEINNRGGHIENIYYCPHLPEDRCPCRKPNPGMLLSASLENNFEIADAYFIGDSISDIQAAHNAGVSPILVLTGHGRDSLSYYTRSDSDRKIRMPDNIFTNLFSASRWLIRTK